MNLTGSTNYKITWNESYIRVDLFNYCTAGDIVAAVKEIVDSPEFDVRIPTIYDLSAADISSFDVDKVVELSLQVADIMEKLGETKSALVSAKEINITLMKFFRAVYKDYSIEIEIFPAFADAVNWVLS